MTAQLLTGFTTTDYPSCTTIVHYAIVHVSHTKIVTTIVHRTIAHVSHTRIGTTIVCCAIVHISQNKIVLINTVH